MTYSSKIRARRRDYGRSLNRDIDELARQNTLDLAANATATAGENRGLTIPNNNPDLFVEKGKFYGINSDGQVALATVASSPKIYPRWVSLENASEGQRFMARTFGPQYVKVDPSESPLPCGTYAYLEATGGRVTKTRPTGSWISVGIFDRAEVDEDDFCLLVVHLADVSGGSI